MEQFYVYFGYLIILIIIILFLLVMAPDQQEFFSLKQEYPALYYNIHENKNAYDAIIKELVYNTNIERIDIIERFSLAIHKELQWVPYSKKPYVKGDVSILPLFCNGIYYPNLQYFPNLLCALNNIPGIINIFIWRFYPNSALLEQDPVADVGAGVISEDDVDARTTMKCAQYLIKLPNINKKSLRYTLSINALSWREEDCFIWVNGKIKMLCSDTAVLWDPLKPFSIHNNTDNDGPIIFLNIDMARTPPGTFQTY